MALTEFQLIQTYFAQASAMAPRDDVLLGIGDDCALLRPRADKALALSIDTLVAGVHFPFDLDPELIGYRSLAVNLSDLAAMGAEPAWFSLALTLPAAEPAWLDAFSRGLFALANRYQVALVGGDTTQGPLTISIQVHGYVPADLALRRDAAREGDLIYVSGTLGDAAAGLQVPVASDDPNVRELLRRFHYPAPRIELGQALLGLAHAAIDISDGLLADLGHILERSGMGARADPNALPLSAALLAIHSREQALDLALSGGDDYELCFTAPPDRAAAIAALAAGLGLPLTCIGRICAGNGILDPHGRPLGTGRGGYQHFQAENS